jgi:hypothetical protein
MGRICRGKEDRDRLKEWDYKGIIMMILTIIIFR